MPREMKMTWRKCVDCGHAFDADVLKHRTKKQRWARCPVCVSECYQDFSYLTYIQNTWIHPHLYQPLQDRAENDCMTWGIAWGVE